MKGCYKTQPLDKPKYTTKAMKYTLGDRIAINLNNNLCQIDDLKSWKQNHLSLKGKQEEGKFRVLYSFLSTSPSSCSDIDPVGLF